MKKNHAYDYVILGGGISGLYAAYLLLQKNSDKNPSILLLEKENHFGGRVYTYHDRAFKSVEAGAGRFSPQLHPLLLKLIRSMGLAHLMYPQPKDSDYFPTGNSCRSGSNIESLWKRVFSASKKSDTESLRNMTVLEFAAKIITKEEVKLLSDSFGYYSELVVMNAADAMGLIESLHPSGGFYGLEGGFSLIIDGLIEKIRDGGGGGGGKVILKKGIEVQNIKEEEDGRFHITCVKDKKELIYTAETCICALPTPVLQQGILEEYTSNTHLRKMLRSVSCQPLCRIYAKYSKDNVWFRGLSKFTTNNDLRMVIPINEEEGTIMISYSDNRFADSWHRLYLKGGVEAVEKKCVRLLEKIFCRDKIPACDELRVFYWDCGVGYWRVGADSKQISSAILRPFDYSRLFICGENFSHTHQQWMEGALETAKKVVDLID